MILPSRFQSQNLASNVTAEAVQRPPGYYKSVILDFICIISALALGYAYRSYLLGNWPFSWTLTLCVPFATASILNVFLMRSASRRFIVLIFEVISLLVFYTDLPAKTIGFLGLFILAVIGWGDWQAYREASNAVQISFFKMATPIMKKMTTALVVAGIVLYMPQWSIDTAFLSEPNFKALYNWALGPAENFYPTVKFNSSVQGFAESIVRDQVKSTPGFENQSPLAQNEIINRSTLETLANIKRTFSIAFEAQDALSDVLYKFLRTIFDNWQKQFGAEFLIAWSVIVFLIFRGIGFIFYGILNIIAFIIYQLLIAANWIRISGESQIREIIQYT